MALIAVNARNAREGGGRTFLIEVIPALERRLLQLGHEVVVLRPSGTAAAAVAPWAREHLAQRQDIRRSALVLNVANVGAMAGGVRQWLMVRNRLLLDGAEHAPSRGWLLSRRALLIEGLLRSERWIVSTAAMADVLLKYARRWHLRRRPIQIIPHGSVVPDAVPRMSRGSGLALLYPAGPSRYKNFDVVLRAGELLASRGVRFSLTLTVRQAQLHTLSSAAAAAGAPWLRCVGPVSPAVMPALYRAHDVLVFPSRCEAFGMPVREAQAFGLQVVAGDTDVAREVGGPTAHYAPLDDPVAWADDIEAAALRRDTIASDPTRHDWTWPDVARQLAGDLHGALAVHA